MKILLNHHTTITRTNFDDFKKKEKCKEDIDLMLAKGDRLAEIIDSCQGKVVHVNNPPIEIKGADEDELNITKRKEKNQGKYY